MGYVHPVSDSVFVLSTGGTIGMVDTPEGYAPVAGALEPYVEWIVENSRAIGTSSAYRIRTKRNTGALGDRPSAIDSSGLTVPVARDTQELLGTRPRATISSLKDDSLEKFFSTRPATNVPAPRRTHAIVK